MARLIRETSTTLRIIIIGAFILAVVFCGAGIWLVYLGATGSTEFSFFGQAFKSANVGIAALFLGASCVVLLLRRALRSLDIAINADAPQIDSSVPVGHWPRTKTLQSLDRKIKTLSDTQWSIIETVAQFEGMSAHGLSERSEMGPSIFYHRLKSLEGEELVTMTKGNVYLAPKVKKLLARRNIGELRG